jgi:hypothetical protein
MLQMKFVGKADDPLRKGGPADPATYNGAGQEGDLGGSDDEVK